MSQREGPVAVIPGEALDSAPLRIRVGAGAAADVPGAVGRCDYRAALEGVLLHVHAGETPRQAAPIRQVEAVVDAEVDAAGLHDRDVLIEQRHVAQLAVVAACL